MLGEPINVFVSYSHADASLVAPVVKLLRVNRSLVFHDIDSIQPGRQWRSEIARGLDQSHLVVVFWCEHASHSDEVAREWQAALAQNKDLLPLLLDATPLPAALGDYQWIDFRDTVGANHGAVTAPPVINPPAPAPATAPGPAPARPSFRAGRWLSVAALMAVVALAGVLSVNIGHQASQPDVPGPVIKPPVDPTKPPPPPPAANHYGVPMALTALLIALAGLLWQRQRAKRRAETNPTTGSGTPGTVEQTIASTLEAEILRRGARHRQEKHTTPQPLR